MSNETKYEIKDHTDTFTDASKRTEHTVEITDISDVRDHSVELWKAGTSPTHDFDGRADKRTKEKFINDRIEGKVGEHVFKRFLESLGYEATVDYDIYDAREITDDADLKSIEGDDPACSFDVKTTKKRNKWLAIRESIYRSHEPTDPFILVLVNPEVVTNPPFSAEVVGWVEKQNITKRIPRGDRLHIPGNEDYKIGPSLKTDNWCIPVEDIPRRTKDQWRDFVEQRLIE